MKRLLQRGVAAIGGYELFRILERDPALAAPPLPPEWDMRSVDDAARDQLALESEPKPQQLAAQPVGPGAALFALWQGATLLGVVLFEPGALPWISAIWPGEGMAMTDLWVIAGVRRRGGATAMIAECGRRIEGPQFAWTWWTNRGAIRASRAAGWRTVGWSFKLGRLPRLRLRTARRRHRAIAFAASGAATG